MVRASRSRPRMRWVGIGLGLALVALLVGGWLVYRLPPEPPIIVEPLASTTPLEALRLELAPMRDRLGGPLAVAEWEIRAEDGTVVWSARGAQGALAADLAQGAFQGPTVAKQRLDYQTAYLARARWQSQRGVWSEWAEQAFVSPATAQVPPWRVRGILSQPAPRWRTDGDAPVTLPSGGTLSLEGNEGARWLTLSGGGSGLTATAGPLLPQSASLRLRLTAPPSAPLRLPTTRLTVVGIWADRAEELTIGLPALTLTPGAEHLLWVSATGATFYGTPSATSFSRDRLARDAAVPWRVPPGYRVEAVTAALQMPTSLAFIPNPGTDPGAPRFYVTELYGRVKVVTNDGRVLPFADRLLNLNPTGVFPGSGEMGVIGVCLPPSGHDVYATMVYRDQAGSTRNKLARLRSDDGLTVRAVEDLLAARPGQGLARAAHQIQQCAFGPDGKIYLGMGDGTDVANAQSDRSFGGKLLRLNPDGSAPTDNPFYDPAQPTAPISYLYAKGFRNPFGLVWHPTDGHLYLSDNGPNIDRLVRVTPGFNYGWDGGDASMETGALYLWPESRWAPTALTVVAGAGAAALPPEWQGHLLVGSSGLVYAKGTMHAGKAIQAIRLDADGRVTQPATRLVTYVGEGRGTIIDVKLQPDGLYFTNLFLDDGEGGATAPGGQVWRVRYVGETTLTATTTAGPAPLAVTFTAATTGDVQGCQWSFGDGQTSDAPNPAHTFAQPGLYTVGLRCVDATGQPSQHWQPIAVTTSDGRLPDPPTTPQPVAAPPAAPALTVAETGMTLAGAFKSFWEANGGATTFGYPISPAYREPSPTDGQPELVQYFERARFSLHPSAPDRVTLAPLGSQVTARRRTEPAFQDLVGGALESTAERLVFAETRHSLSGPFRQRWERDGGAAIFGLPISEPLRETSSTDGQQYLVQYFERARMEYHPEEAGRSTEIRLARLGTAVVVSTPARRAPA